MPSYVVILVEPKHPGNIGAVARVMMNFNVESLFLVNPCAITDDSYVRAVHAHHILDNAIIFHSFEEAIHHVDFTVATSAKETISEKKHLRSTLYVHEFSKQIQQTEGSIGLVFGREDNGLLNSEISACDVIVRIPTDPDYETLNLSHSVGIFLYTLYLSRTLLPEKRTPIDGIEKQHLYKAFSDLLRAIDYPNHKIDNTEVMFKRLISRAIPSKWEYHTLMGVIGTAAKKLKQKKK